FWVKLWHSSAEQTRVERVQIISCLPSTRGVQILVDGPDDYADGEDFDDDEEFDEDGPYHEGEELSAAEADEEAAGGEGVIDVEDGGRA
ncbi:MAG TPA: hypothetical protein VNZ44_15175, partial [Pyrinomonadaceae bacterium]|nr:hypothetical protein [Pyrinomonadaceae bacterium]